MKELAIQAFLSIGIFSVALSLLLVVFYWWETRQWRRKKEALRQMYESDVSLEEIQKAKRP